MINASVKYFVSSISEKNIGIFHTKLATKGISIKRKERQKRTLKEGMATPSSFLPSSLQRFAQLAGKRDNPPKKVRFTKENTKCAPRIPQKGELATQLAKNSYASSSVNGFFLCNYNLVKRRSIQLQSQRRSMRRDDF